ncbi:hypothetical protein [Burkholderia sp. Bp9143]|nr:hypothetical protein [Burkholderia sp. Bp9143]
MEHLEIVGPADFKSIDVEGPRDVPAPTPWGDAGAWPGRPGCEASA